MFNLLVQTGTDRHKQVQTVTCRYKQVQRNTAMNKTTRKTGSIHQSLQQHLKESFRGKSQVIGIGMKPFLIKTGMVLKSFIEAVIIFFSFTTS